MATRHGSMTQSKNKNSYEDQLKDVILTAGIKISDHVLGVGNFGIVFKADYNGIPCAAKQIYSSFLRYWHNEENTYWFRECFYHSKLQHDNVVKMLGVYHNEHSFLDLPVLVMERMEYTLRQLTMNDEELFIPMYVKLSLLQDISRGLHYLHTRNPPMIHCDLGPDNILLTKDLVAKLGDFGDVKESPIHRDSFRYYQYGLVDHKYCLQSEVLLFGCMACHVITQKWPTQRSETTKFSVQSVTIFSSQLIRCCHYIDEISDGPVKQLLKLCLMKDEKERPSISLVYERISDIMISEIYRYFEVKFMGITGCMHNYI